MEDSFTAEAVEGLINEAFEKACEDQGSKSVAGSCSSQPFHQQVHEAILAREERQREQSNSGQLLEVICDILKIT